MKPFIGNLYRISDFVGFAEGRNDRPKASSWKNFLLAGIPSERVVVVIHALASRR
ncbi:hypothetical protein [Paraburkholderia franconis]|uniref:hypothetical protein n=1 Tax=Paraburkholderia franconis TaxID=2654983 RepID=UPI00187B61A1|nr:hypothetical protein [Paraburkholderia franconis]